MRRRFLPTAAALAVAVLPLLSRWGRADDFSLPGVTFKDVFAKAKEDAGAPPKASVAPAPAIAPPTWGYAS